jgi:polyribonucleotide nucleotidyltransferase
MLEAIKFAHTHQNQMATFASCFCKKRSSYTEKEKTKLFTLKQAYDKIYAISKGSSKQERTAAFEAVKEEVKSCLLKKNYRRRRFSF